MKLQAEEFPQVMNTNLQIMAKWLQAMHMLGMKDVCMVVVAFTNIPFMFLAYDKFCEHVAFICKISSR